MLLTRLAGSAGMLTETPHTTDCKYMLSAEQIGAKNVFFSLPKYEESLPPFEFDRLNEKGSTKKPKKRKIYEKKSFRIV